MNDALQDLTDADLGALSAALRRGELAAPFDNESLIARHCPKHLASKVGGVFTRLVSDGFGPVHIATLLNTISETRTRRPELEELIDLVWTGPIVDGQTHRETASAVRELFASATKSVLVATFVIQRGRAIFEPLADRMLLIPGLKVELFADLNGQSPQDFAQKFVASDWPFDRPLPAVYIDPRSGPGDPARRASLHAKLVATDSANVLVTSANFTERAHSKNVEAGLLVRSDHLAAKIERNFQRLIESGQIHCLKLPT